jgi:hypothetical protein
MRRPDFFFKEPRQLDGYRLGFASARIREKDTISFRRVSLKLLIVSFQRFCCYRIEGFWSCQLHFHEIKRSLDVWRTHIISGREEQQCQPPRETFLADRNDVFQELFRIEIFPALLWDRNPSRLRTEYRGLAGQEAERTVQSSYRQSNIR